MRPSDDDQAYLLRPEEHCALCHHARSLHVEAASRVAPVCLGEGGRPCRCPHFALSDGPPRSLRAPGRPGASSA